MDGHETGHSQLNGDIWIRKEGTPRLPWLIISLFKEPFGGILSDTRIVRGKNTVSVSTNPKVAFAVPMDARTCHFHRTVGYGANGCRKIRIASRMMMMMLMMMRMMTMMLMMRHCEGAAA